MENIKIAIIDSGIDTKNKYLMKYVKDGKSFILNDSLDAIIEGTDIKDNNGHGTSCAYTILRRNENIEIFPIKVVDKSGRTNSECVLKALEFLKGSDIKLINVSLSTVNFKYKEKYLNTCNQLTSEGKIIIASMDNRYRDSLPSILPSVVGVRGKNFGPTDNYLYDKEKEVQCTCSNHAIIVPGIKEQVLEFFRENSKATALMTANISKLLNTDISLNFSQVNEILNNNQMKSNLIVNDSNQFYKKCNEKIDYDLKSKIYELYELIKKTYKSDNLDVEFIYENPLFNDKTKMNKYNFYKFLYAIEDKFNKKIDYDKISYRTFNSIYSLIDAIEL